MSFLGLAKKSPVSSTTKAAHVRSVVVDNSLACSLDPGSQIAYIVLHIIEINNNIIANRLILHYLGKW